MRRQVSIRLHVKNPADHFSDAAPPYSIRNQTEGRIQKASIKQFLFVGLHRPVQAIADFSHQDFKAGQSTAFRDSRASEDGEAVIFEGLQQLDRD